jgi:hypothetical protein
MCQAVRELKQLCLHFNDDKGLVVVSPVQGNRKGYAAAVANGGAWEASDIHMYGEMEKSADNILYTFQPDELKADNKMKLGFCKTRRHGPTAPLQVIVDPQVGLVGGSPQDDEDKKDKKESKAEQRRTIKDQSMEYDKKAS